MKIGSKDGGSNTHLRRGIVDLRIGRRMEVIMRTKEGDLWI